MWIVGLGNPGSKYEATRHNVGFMALDRLAHRLGISFQSSKHRALIADGMVDGQKISLIKPQTYMNLSGESVRSYMDFYKANLDDLIVVYDDLDLPLGQIRLRYKGSAGGHNGMKSIIQHVGTTEFKRIRIGISKPVDDVIDYVLSPFSRAEQPLLDQTLYHVCDALEKAVSEPFDKVMAQYNVKRSIEEEQ